LKFASRSATARDAAETTSSCAQANFRQSDAPSENHGARRAPRGPRRQIHTPILPDSAAAAHEYDSDLARALHVRAAAGLQISTFDLDSSQNPVALTLCAPEFRQLVRGSVADVDGPILEDNTIRGAFRALKNFVSRFGAAQINRAHSFPIWNETVGSPKRS